MRKLGRKEGGVETWRSKNKKKSNCNVMPQGGNSTLVFLMIRHLKDRTKGGLKMQMIKWAWLAFIFPYS